jgi:hypothetical protein
VRLAGEFTEPLYILMVSLAEDIQFGGFWRFLQLNYLSILTSLKIAPFERKHRKIWNNFASFS